MNGILIVDKPKGITSHGVVDFIRRKFSVKKVGHAGTLDPRACGLLVMLLGNFTRKSCQFMNDDKEYDVILKLGIRKDTQDSEGKVISEADYRHLTREDIKKVFSQFKGKKKQLPPMFSAVRYKGRKLYELARKGKVVERTPRSIEIYKLEISYIELPYVSFRAHCSKGTYIRQLCSDIGDKLGCGAYMHYLRRIRSGRFSISDAVTLKELGDMDRGSLRRYIT